MMQTYYFLKKKCEKKYVQENTKLFQNWFQLGVYYLEAWFLHSECSITN